MISIKLGIVVVVSLLSLAVVVQGAAPTPPATLSSYISYTPGDSNIIISVPHGGSQRPSSVQHRTACPGVFKGCLLANNTCDYSHDQSPGQDCQCGSSKCRVSYLTDGYTQGIASDLRDQIESLTGKKPHVIISNLQRRKLDANREKDQATFGDVTSGEAWETYHYYIAKAKYDIEQGSPSYGLLLDIHGQAHTDEWTEMGYALSHYDIKNDRYDTRRRDERATICSLVNRVCGQPNDAACFKDLVRLGSSFGERLAQKTDPNGVNYKVIPSVLHPVSGAGILKYFTGGYIVKRHGSRDCPETGSTVDSIQVEAPRGIRFAAPSVRQHFSNALGSVVVDFMQAYYGW